MDCRVVVKGDCRVRSKSLSLTIDDSGDVLWQIWCNCESDRDETDR